MAWTKTIVISLIGAYTAFLVNNIQKHTSSPTCTPSSRDCLQPAVQLNESFYLNLFLTNAQTDRLQFNKTISVLDDKGNGHPILAPARKKNSEMIHVGTIRTSMDKQNDCQPDKIVHGAGATEQSSRSPLARLWKRENCKTYLQWQVPPHWRTNNTQVWIMLTATLYKDPTKIAFAPYTAPISSLYHPETKTKSARRFLLTSNAEYETRPMFDGASYVAVPPRIAIGPLAYSKPLDEEKLMRSNMNHWLRVEGETYRQNLLVNPYISPRDEHWPLEKPDIKNAKIGSTTLDENPITKFEFATTSYRAAAIQALMKPALHQMETAFGTSQYDSDSIMLLIVGESPVVLLLTFTISMLHLVFEFLAMSSNLSHVQDMVADPSMNKSLSRKSILLEILFEIAIAGWLWDEGEAKIVQFVIAARIAFNSWKLVKLGKPIVDGEGKDVKKKKLNDSASPSFALLSLDELNRRRSSSTAEEFETSCLRTIGLLLSPVFVAIAVYQLVYRPHRSWLSWFLKTAALFSYLGGFVAMTPQLFTNYYYRTVESLSWTSLIYQFLNTIIDDVFAFVIRMPKAHRVSVFRDDLILLIYYMQKRHYKQKTNPSSTSASTASTSNKLKDN